MALKVYKCHSDLFSKNCCLVSRDTGLPATGFGALFTRHPPDRHKMLVDPKLLQTAQNISELIKGFVCGGGRVRAYKGQPNTLYMAFYRLLSINKRFFPSLISMQALIILSILIIQDSVFANSPSCYHLFVTPEAVLRVILPWICIEW